MLSHLTYISLTQLNFIHYFENRACPNFTRYVLYQCFPTFFGSRHPYILMMTFRGTPRWFNRYKDQGILRWHPWHHLTPPLAPYYGTPVRSYCSICCASKIQLKSTGTKAAHKMILKLTLGIQSNWRWTYSSASSLRSISQPQVFRKKYIINILRNFANSRL